MVFWGGGGRPHTCRVGPGWLGMGKEQDLRGRAAGGILMYAVSGGGLRVVEKELANASRIAFWTPQSPWGAN